MRKFPIFVFLTITLLITASCNTAGNNPPEKFYALANIYISGVKFRTEITDEYIKFDSENLSNQIIYTNGQMIYENVCSGITPTNNSPLHIQELLKYILTTKNNIGTYKNIDYTCEFDAQNHNPYKIKWGKVTVEFDYFE